MKKLFILILAFVSFSLGAQIGSGAATSFNYGTKYPNATKSDTLSSQTRIPILKANDNNLMNIYVPIEDLGAYVTGILWGNITGTLSDQTDLQAALDSKVTKVGTPVNNEIGIWTGDATLKGDPNLTWSGTQMLMQNTESAINPAIQIGTNGRDVSTWGQGVTTAFNHTSADFNAFADMSIVNLAADDNVGYGAFDVSTQVRGTFGLNHFFGYQSRLDYGSSTPLITSGIFNSMTSFWSSNVVNSGSTVPNAIGMLYQDVTGGGTVENQYGIYINPLSKGTINNYGIFSDNNNYFKSADIDQLVVDAGFPGITVKQDSYIVFGDNGEVDMAYGGAPLDMYINLIGADNLFIRDDQTTRFTFERTTGDFTATGNITGNSFIKSGGTSSQFLKADGSVDSNSYALTSALPTTYNQSLVIANGVTSTVVTAATNKTYTGHAYMNSDPTEFISFISGIGQDGVTIQGSISIINDLAGGNFVVTCLGNTIKIENLSGSSDTFTVKLIGF